MRGFGLTALAAATLAAGCGSRESVPASVYMDPAVRAAQESACAAAVAEVRGVDGGVLVARASSDPANNSIVNARAGGANGYCRVTAAGEVVEVVF